MSKYFPKKLQEVNIQSFAEDIFEGGMRIKPQLRKGVWPHLVRVFHPRLETHEERESYLSKLRLIYDSLKGRLHSQNGSPISQSQHLYDSIRRDAVRTDPNESFYAQRCEDAGSPPVELRLSEDNIEKLVNIIAIFTLEHDNVAYTQGMTDLLSPILYVMGREDDAYIVFAAMLQRISENFSVWCEGTLKKIERLRHLCDVLDPQLSAYLAGIDDDAYALFFGMVLIECRREFSFANSFHLMEVIWAAALCMRQREDPNWSPPSTSARRKHADIQVSSPDTSQVFSTPTFCEWASFMSNRSPDIIRQVFGEVQPYSAAPLSRDNSILSHRLSHSASLRSYSPLLPEHVLPLPSGEACPPQTEVSVLEASRRVGENDSCKTLKQNGGLVWSGKHHSQVGNALQGGEQYSSMSQGGEAIVNEVEVEVHTPLTLKPQDEGAVTMFASSPGKDRSQSDPLRARSSTFTSGVRTIPTSNKRVKDTAEVLNADDIQIGDTCKMLVMPNGQIVSNSFSESELACSSPPQHFFPAAINTKQSHTEMSDMSSVSSVGTNNTNNGRGTLVASLNSGDNHTQGEEGERNAGIEMDGTVRVKGGNKEIGEHGINGIEVHGRGGWRAVSNGEDVGREKEGEGEVEGRRDKNEEWREEAGQKGPPNDEDQQRPPYCTATLDGSTPLISNDAAHQGTARVDQNGFISDGSRSSLDHTDNPDSLISKKLPQVVSRDSGTILDDTLHNTTGDDSLEMPAGINTTIVRKPSLVDERREPPFSPIQPFFDTLETIATLSRTASPVAECGSIPRPSSTLSVIISNLRSMEHSAPAVTRESSLAVPFSDSFPLFICLSIIIQHRSQILHNNLDFVGLSQLLNAQAGMQNLDQTLRIAHELYVKYRQYQRLCFGPRFAVYEVWLDNMDTLFERPTLHSSPQVASDEQHTAG